MKQTKPITLKSIQKILSLILTAVILSTMLPMTALAEGPEGLPDGPEMLAEELEGLSDEESVAADIAWLQDTARIDFMFGASDYILEDGVTVENVTESVYLPATGPNGSAFNWTSDNESVINISGATVDGASIDDTAEVDTALVGTVTRRASETEESDTVNLSVTVAKNAAADAFGFTAQVPVIYAMDDETAIENASQWLEEYLENNSHPVPDSADYYIPLPAEGPDGSSIVWTSYEVPRFGNKPLSGTEITIKRPSYAEGDNVYCLYAYLIKGDTRSEWEHYVTVPALEYTADDDVVSSDYDWLESQVGSIYDTAVDYTLNLPVTAPGGSTIAWFPENPALISPDGELSQPSYTNGDYTSGTWAKISYGSAVKWYLLTFDAIARDYEYGDFLIEKDLMWLNTTMRLRTGEYLNTYYDYFTDYDRIVLPYEAPNGSVISWSTDSTSIGADGTVLRRPEPENNTINGGIRATLALGDRTKTTDFTILIRPDPGSGAFEQAMDSLQGEMEALQLEMIGYYGNEFSDRFQLPVCDYGGGPIIAWQSSDSSIIDVDVEKQEPYTFGPGYSRTVYAVVNRPSAEEGDKTVTLTATLTRGTYTDTRAFDITVKAATPEKEEWFLEQDLEALDNDLAIDGIDDGRYWATDDVVLRRAGLYGSAINWTSSDPDIISADGKVYPPLAAASDGDVTVTLTATLTRGSLSAQKTIDMKVASLVKTSVDQVAQAKAYLTEEKVLNGNSEDNVTDNLDLPVNGSFYGINYRSSFKEKYDFNFPYYNPLVFNVNIAWGSSELGVISGNGEVTRPPLGSPDVSVTLTATITSTDPKRTSTATKTFDVTVAAIRSDADSVAFDGDWLTNGAGLTRLLNGNSGADNVTTDLCLPAEGPNGSAVSWGSDNAHISAADGTVTLPAPAEGAQTVTLTATLSKGEATATRTIQLNLPVTDANAVSADSDWLDASRILNGNSALDNITGKLTLPMTGQYGSAISWTISDTNAIWPTGTVWRPTYSTGDKTVTLTARIRKGTSETTKTFTVTVKALDITDNESVLLDDAWLTDDIIGGGNTGLDNITENLSLPVTGPKGTTITWTSSKDSFVSAGGMVTRPTYTQGDQRVFLTVSITKETTTRNKSFSLLLPKLARTPEETVAEDAAWLDASRTLGSGNLSQYAVSYDLNLPVTAPNGSSITWASDSPDVISDGGHVTRPSSVNGNKKVSLTATIKNGAVENTKVIAYTVTAPPDTAPPYMVSATPALNSSVDEWATQEVQIIFNEPIKMGTWTRKIGVSWGGRTYTEDTVSYAWVDGSTLNIRFNKPMTPGVNTIFFSSDVVTDMAGNKVGDLSLSFKVLSHSTAPIEVISSTPADREKEFAPGSALSFRFNNTEITEGKSFGDISLRARDGAGVAIAGKSLSGDTVTVDLGDSALSPGTVYELVIPEGAVADRFFPQSNKSAGKIIVFRTKGDDREPEISEVYPASGGRNVDILQSVMINFSEAVKVSGASIILRDSSGKNVDFAVEKTEGTQDSISLRPFKPLDVETTYTLTIPYGAVKNLQGNTMVYDYTTSFTTRATSLSVTSASPKANAKIYLLNTPVVINFSGPVTRVPGSEGISWRDSSGADVPFTISETGNKVVLTPTALLGVNNVYSVTLPQGAYKGASSYMNSEFKFKFSTASLLIWSDTYNFTVKPSTTMLANRPVQFSAENLQQLSIGGGYGSLTSAVWDFGDETSGSGINAEHSYGKRGVYGVHLQVRDSMGLTYDFQQFVFIKEEDMSLISLEVSPDEIQMLYNALYDTDSENEYKLFQVRLYRENALLPNEPVRVRLYKNGTLAYDLGTVTTGKGEHTYLDENRKSCNDFGVANFYFYYDRNMFNNGHYETLQGTYELAFTYGNGSGEKSVRTPVTITQSNKSKEDLRFKVYNTVTGEVQDSVPGWPNGVIVLLDGRETVAESKWLNAEEGYSCVIQGVDTGKRHTLELPMSDTRYTYYSDPETIYHRNSEHFYLLPIKKKEIGLDVIKSAISDSRNDRDSIIFGGFSRKDIRLEFQGDWGGALPGYYEIKTSSGKFHKTTTDPWCDIDPFPDNLTPGDRLLARMVGAQEIVSPWVDAKIEVLPAPPLPISVEGGEYVVTGDFLLYPPAVHGGGISLANGVPFLGGLSDWGAFGSDFTSNSIKVESYVDNEGRVHIGFGRGWKGMGKTREAPKDEKKTVQKMRTAGYEVEAEFSAGMIFAYNRESGTWDMDMGELTVMADGNYYWKKGYRISIAELAAKLTLGAKLGGTFIIERSGNRNTYKGIIRFEPYVKASMEGGIKGANIEGYVQASIPAELHTTGYFGAGVDVKSGIRVNFLTWSKDIYEKRIANEHWDNGGERADGERKAEAYKIFFNAFVSALNEAQLTPEAQMAPTGRSNLDRGSQWLPSDTGDKGDVPEAAGRKALMTAAQEERDGASQEDNPSVEPLLSNVFPGAEVQLAHSDDQLWLIWNDDNPARSANNRTQLRYAVSEDGRWPDEPEWLGDDGTADFSPAAAAVDAGVLIAWQDMGKAMSYGDGIDAMIENSEISVTRSVCGNDGGEPDIVTLTDDDKYDHSPVLAADGDKALLVWTKSDGMDVSFGEEAEGESSAANSDGLYFSAWDGENWSDAALIADSLPDVTDSSLHMHGNEGLLLYVLDTDGDSSTDTDRELFARLYDGSAWGEEISLTSDELPDSRPEAVYLDGKWFITWYRDGSLVYKDGLTGETGTDEALDSVQGNYELAARGGDEPLIGVVYKNMGDDGYSQGISASFYDADDKTWSGEVPLLEGDGYVRSISPEFTGDGKLNVAYTQAQLVAESVDGEEYVNPSDKVDMYRLTYTPVHDLALDEDGLTLPDAVPVPETVTTVSAVVRNEGDFAENAIVDLYEGDPGSGGVKVASAATSQLIPAGSSVSVDLEWLVSPGEQNEYDLYAVVRPAEDAAEADTDNNTVNREISTIDIEITDLTYSNLAKDDYLVTANVANHGSRALERILVRLDQGEDGEPVGTQEIGRLEPGEKAMVSFLVASGDLIADADGNVNIALRATLRPETGMLRAALLSAADEAVTDNTADEFTLKPSYITVDRASPGPGDTQAPIDSVLTLGFNMNIGKGIGFDRITLEDEYLNAVDAAKTLDGNTLTIAPLSPLEYDTRYTLTIPADALGDAYGHVMERSYRLSFTTMTTAPQVIFAYPGNGMEKTAPDTGIRLKFNQNVEKGPTFEDIKMYGPDGEAVSAAISLAGEWLSVLPSGSLTENTAYSLTIPAGAVKNASGEAQQEDYVLKFTTGSREEADNPPNDTDRDKHSTPIHTPASYSANVTIGGNTQASLPAAVNAGEAEINLGDLAGEIFDGGNNGAVSVPSIPGVSSYTLKMPASALAGTYGKTSLVFGTGIGSVTIPSGMLSGMPDLGGKSAGITIAAGDRTQLPDDIKAAVGNRPLIRLTLTLDGVRTDWSNPDAPVTVSIPYTPTAAELANPESIIVWYIDGSGNVICVTNGHYDPATGTVTFSATHFSDYAVAYNKVSFNDVAAAAWYNKAVSFIAAREITNGTGGGNYSPDARLTRGEFIVLMMRAYGIAPDTDPADNFADAGNTYYTGYLAAAKRLGISAGVGNDLYAPATQITRQEMFTLLYNALKAIKQLPGGNSGKKLPDFNDARQIDAWAKDAMALLVETGTVSGSGGRLNPTGTATRAEMAQVLYNLLKE